MKELRQQTLRTIIEKYPTKGDVIVAALEGMIADRITEHVKQALSSADIPELQELLEIAKPAPIEAVTVPVVEATSVVEAAPIELTIVPDEPVPAPKHHNHKKKHKNKKPADLLD